QSYFLYRLKQEQLKALLFPLGDYTKTQVRKIAAEFNLPVKDKPGSQEICFIPDDDYRAFLSRALRSEGLKIRPGPIVDSSGKVLGEHKGIPFYTIGQREGLGIAAGYPIYIIRMDSKENTIVAGKKEEAFSSGLIAGDLSFINEAMKREIALRVKIRYNHREVPAKVSPESKNKLKVVFSQAQFAVTPGQSVVFYRGNTVIGGGIIESALKDAKIG
ncbi:MAG: aminomethyltransferase beta-barrel domain-containing protein, partial [Candidatus Omnitrophota bacterium]